MNTNGETAALTVVDTSADTSADTSVGAEVDLDAYVDALAAQVSQTELEATIQALQDFGTRYTGTQSNHDAHEYLKERLEGYGLEVEEDHFSWGSSPPHGSSPSGDGDATNLIARLDGSESPEQVWIFSAHYDSTSTQPETSAPGADDNASGVAAVLEAARLLSGQPHRDSLWFVLTGAEEQGSKGSEHMALWLDEQGIDVQGVIAPDMIAYWPLGDGDAFDILGDDESTHLVESMGAVADQLGVANKQWIFHYYCYGDDHTNFQEMGFPSVAPMDCVEAHNIGDSGESTPHYHKTTDTLDSLYLPFTTRVASVLIASFSSWGDPILE